jgi:hypothetical protein
MVPTGNYVSTLKYCQGGHRVHGRDERTKGKALDEVEFVHNIGQAEQVDTYKYSIYITEVISI